MDTGTTEIHKRLTTRVERRRSGTVCIRVLDGNEVDRLLWSDMITPDEHSVLTGFQLDAHRAGLLVPRASNLQRVSGGGRDMSDAEALLRLKHGKSCDILLASIGRSGLSRFLAICLDGSPAILSDLPMLRHACVILMDFRVAWMRESHPR